MEIKISEKLDKKIKKYLNVNFNDHTIFYAFASFINTICFVLRDKDNNFIGIKIRDNKITEICMLKLFSMSYNNVRNRFCKIDKIFFVREKRMFYSIYERKMYYIDEEDEETTYKHYVDDSFLETNEFLTFLKLYEFNNFKKEVNSKIDYEFLKTLETLKGEL